MERIEISKNELSYPRRVVHGYTDQCRETPAFEVHIFRQNPNAVPVMAAVVNYGSFPSKVLNGTDVFSVYSEVEPLLKCIKDSYGTNPARSSEIIGESFYALRLGLVSLAYAGWFLAYYNQKQGHFSLLPSESMVNLRFSDSLPEENFFLYEKSDVYRHLTALKEGKSQYHRSLDIVRLGSAVRHAQDYMHRNRERNYTYEDLKTYVLEQVGYKDYNMYRFGFSMPKLDENSRSLVSLCVEALSVVIRGYDWVNSENKD